MSSVLVEELGPRGKRRVRVASIASVVLLVLLLIWLVNRLASEGQFAGRLWAQFIDFESEWPQFLVTGLWGTVRAAIGAMVISATLGLLLALGRLSRTRPIRMACGFLIDVLRGPPVLLMIFIAYYAIPQILPGDLGTTIGRQPLYALVLGLSLYNMAVLAEIYRAGILSLDRGQSEAAYSIGMTYWQAMITVILPQALRRMVPSILAQLATLTKDTSLGYIITVSGDLMGRGRSFAQGGPLNDLQTWFGVAIIYFILIWGLTRFARGLEIRQRQTGGRAEAEDAPPDPHDIGGAGSGLGAGI